MIPQNLVGKPYTNPPPSSIVTMSMAYSVQSPFVGRYTLDSVELGPHLVSFASMVLLVPAEILTVYHSFPFSCRMTNWKNSERLAYMKGVF